jgi:heme exporter protein B
MSLSLPSHDSSLAPARSELQPVQMETRGGLSSYLRKVWAIAAKDLRTEVRAKEIFSTMASFSVLAVIIFGMAFDLRVPQAAMVVPGVLWAVVLFAGILGLNRSFGAEADRGSLPALLLAPVDRSAIYFGKFLAHLLFMLATEAVVVPMVLIIFNVNLFQPSILLGLFLGTIGYVAVGTLFAALTASTRARESMLPILLLPVMAPIFVAGIGLTASTLDGRSLADTQHWLYLLGGYDLLFLTVAYLVFDLIWEEA